MSRFNRLKQETLLFKAMEIHSALWSTFPWAIEAGEVTSCLPLADGTPNYSLLHNRCIYSAFPTPSAFLPNTEYESIVLTGPTDDSKSGMLRIGILSRDVLKVILGPATPQVLLKPHWLNMTSQEIMDEELKRLTEKIKCLRESQN